MTDGTQDVSGKEQEVICQRYIDHDLVHEEFVGLYEVSDHRTESRKGSYGCFCSVLICRSLG